MNVVRNTTSARRVTAAGLICVLLLLAAAVPVSAAIQTLQNAFNPRGYFVTLKNGGDTQWLRSTFVTGFYRSGSGGQGGGTGDGGSSRKDDLGHSNVVYSGEENGLDYVDAKDVDTIYATFDHNPTPGKDFLIGYAKDEQAGQLAPIPDFVSAIGNPVRPGPTDPSGGAWWSIPVNLSLGEENEDGSKNALADGTVYEFAFLRGCRANNSTTCVLMPGDEPGTYKGYIQYSNMTEEEKAEYEAHKYDEYEFVTAILPEGTSRDKSVDHYVETVPMRYRIQTYASLKSWTESAEHKEAEEFLAAVSEADYASGKYIRENVESLRSTLEALDEEADKSVKYQLQKDAEWTILQMIEDLKAALEVGKQNKPVVHFDNYNNSLDNAKIIYDSLKDQTGRQEGQYRPAPIAALKQAIDHAESTINDQSTQVQVDAEENALDNAVMNALDARITNDEEIVFIDDVTGIVVTALASSLPTNARLVVREVVSGTTEYNDMVARVSPAPDAVAIYRILFYDGEDVVAPTKPVTVQIPLQDQFEETTPSVYYLDNAGSPGTEVTATAPEGYRIFETNTLGTFVLAGQKQEETEEPTAPEQPTTPEQPTSSNQEEPTSGNNSQEPSSQNVDPVPAPSGNNPSNNQNNNQNNNNTTRNQQNPATTQPQQHSTTRTTTRSAATRTTRIIRTTRDERNSLRTQNELTTTSVLQTQAVQPTTMTTTTAPTTAKDTSDLEQDADQNTLLYIALAIAAVGLGAAGYEYAKDQKNGNNDIDL